MADFTGFYLDGIHSSTYGILRVSNGKRYSEKLIPEFEDYELELAGGDGSFYGGSNFKKTSFEIKIAFDTLTEEQFRNLRRWLGKKELQSFRFDERPYKTYWVKLESAPALEYVCFMEKAKDSYFGEKERIYKGEGALKFIAYNPFGYCCDDSTKMTEEGLQTTDGINWQALSSYAPFEIVDDNVGEWGLVSGLKGANQLKEYNTFVRYREQIVHLGDFNDDGKIDDDDIEMLSKIIEKPSNFTLKQRFLADLDQNGKLEDVDKSMAESQKGTPGAEVSYQSPTMKAKLYNPGDFDTDFQMFIDLSDLDYTSESGIIEEGMNISLYFNREDNEEEELEVTGFIFSIKGLYKNSQILLNTKNHSLAVIHNGVKSMRYDLIKSTHWPKVPIGETTVKLQIAKSLGKNVPQIKYSYKYY